MAVIVGLLVALLLLLILLLGIGAAVGLLIERLLAIDRGIALLVGVASTAFSVHLLVRLVQDLPPVEDPALSDQDLPDVVIAPLWKPLRSRGRKRKP